MARPTMRFQQRFEAFMNKVEKTESCWIWKGTKSQTGYGMAWTGTRNVKAHRLSLQFKLKRGLPPRQPVLHSCNNRLCVNPEHLRLGTHKQNTADAIKAMTFPVCQKNGMAKLTSSHVREIRRLYKPWKFGCLKLARIFNVSKRCISQVVSGKSWRHENYVAA